MPLKPFWCFFPVKINKMWNFCLKLWFFMNHLSHRIKTCAIGFGTPQTLNMCHSSHFDVFFPVKINKMWNFCLKLWFFLNYLLYRLETNANGFGTPQTLNLCHSSHFDAFFPVKINKMWTFLALCLTPPDKKWKKKHQFEQAWKFSHIGFGVCQ